MRIRGSFIVLVLSFWICLPLAVQPVPSNNSSVMAALDVCHAAGTAVSINADMPVIHENCFTITFPEFTHLREFGVFSSPSVILSFRLERPPKA
jgi:hypothetical protein